MTRRNCWCLHSDCTSDRTGVVFWGSLCLLSVLVLFELRHTLFASHIVALSDFACLRFCESDLIGFVGYSVSICIWNSSPSNNTHNFLGQPDGSHTEFAYLPPLPMPRGKVAPLFPIWGWMVSLSRIRSRFLPPPGMTRLNIDSMDCCHSSAGDISTGRCSLVTDPFGNWVPACSTHTDLNRPVFIFKNCCHL